jgi:hypothetical protein
LGFQGRQFHQDIGLSQEGKHSIHTGKKIDIYLKVDISKSFDQVSWLYIKLLLIQLGIVHSFVSWVLKCINTTSFSLLINGSTSRCFTVERVIQQGFPLSSLLFILVVEILKNLVHQASSLGQLKGILIGSNFTLTHLLFASDILIFCEGYPHHVGNLNLMLQTFCKETKMTKKLEKSTLIS